jgi:signal transduction histidine kinase
MKTKSRSILFFSILFGYVLLQFTWWEILLVKQNDKIITEKQKLIELSTPDESRLISEIKELHEKKKMQTLMIVGEGTVFLLLLLFGVYKVKQAHDKENYLNRQQKNFFLSITHELKTPIAATKLQLQTLQKQKLDPEIRQQLITNALLETDRLNTLIDNVLFASRLESNEFLFKREKQNLSDFISLVLNRYYKNEIEKGEIKMMIEPQIQYELDVNALPSVITNLLGNALKYSNAEKEITVSLKKFEKYIALEVSDKGLGIAEQERKKIFDKFYRSGNEETRRSKGTGLGLYIVDYILKKHNASIRVKDNTPQGSIFEITFYEV